MTTTNYISRRRFKVTSDGFLSWLKHATFDDANIDSILVISV